MLVGAGRLVAKMDPSNQRTQHGNDAPSGCLGEMVAWIVEIFADLVPLIFIVSVLMGQIAPAVAEDGELAAGETLGNEICHLWPLGKPTFVDRHGKIVLDVPGDVSGQRSSTGASASSIDLAAGLAIGDTKTSSQ